MELNSHQCLFRLFKLRQSLNKHWICIYPNSLVRVTHPKTPIEIKIKGDVIIRIIEWIKKIKEYYKIIKADVLKTLSGTKAECTLPFDLEDLERIVRCIFPDIVKYYEEKRSLKNESEVSVPLTNDTVLSDNNDAENLHHDKGGIKI